MPTPSTILRIAGAALLLLSWACATAAPIRVPAVRPAEIDMAPYETVAVGQLGGKADPGLAQGVEEALVASKHFQVIDQQRTAAALREQQLSWSDLSQPAKAAKLGKVLGKSILIYGAADQSYREESSEQRMKENDSITTLVKLLGEMTVRATFRLVDVSTGQTVVTETYEEKRSDTSNAVDRRPDPIDKQRLARSARAELVERFLKAVLPYQEYVTAAFQTDSDLKELDRGIGFAEQGEWKKAEEAFGAAVANLTKSPDPDRKKLAKAYWNLGLAYEYAGDYDKATQTVRKAYELTQDKSMLRELDGIDSSLRQGSRRVSADRAAPEVASGK
ncbi:MAG: tetratricopeptide repeat protein [Myxococcales bacterium]